MNNILDFFFNPKPTITDYNRILPICFFFLKKLLKSQSFAESLKSAIWQLNFQNSMQKMSNYKTINISFNEIVWIVLSLLIFFYFVAFWKLCSWTGHVRWRVRWTAHVRWRVRWTAHVRWRVRWTAHVRWRVRWTAHVRWRVRWTAYVRWLVNWTAHVSWPIRWTAHVRTRVVCVVQFSWDVRKQWNKIKQN